MLQRMSRTMQNLPNNANVQLQVFRVLQMTPRLKKVANVQSFRNVVGTIMSASNMWGPQDLQGLQCNRTFSREKKTIITMLRILQFVRMWLSFKKTSPNVEKPLKNVANDAETTKWCKCAVAGLQNVANDAEISKKK